MTKKNNIIETDIKRIGKHLESIFKILKFDMSDPNLKDTPSRVARMYREIFSGLDETTEPKMTLFRNEDGYHSMVIVKDIPFYSVCAHHIIPFYGRAHIAYLPCGYILGLSKLARIVDYFAKRPQVQERLTEQIVDYLENKIKPEGCIAVVEAAHLCMEMRGIKKPGTWTVTSALRGNFRDLTIREEFFSLLSKQRTD